MDPITIGILIAAVKVLAVAVVIIAILTFDEIIQWFLENEYRIEDDDQLAFTIHQNLVSGKHVTIQGVFDKQENKVRTGRKINSNEIDEKVRAAHSKEELVIYE